jgi:hypothetical protein
MASETYPKNNETWMPQNNGNGGDNQWVLPLMAILGVLGLICAALSWFLMLKPADEAAVIRLKSEAVVGSQGVRLGDYPDGREWLSFYRAYEELLGEPLRGEHAVGNNPNCVLFTNFLVCRSQDPGVQDTLWEYPIQMLGLTSLPAGVSREVDAPMAAPSKTYVDHLVASGREWLYWLGRPVSRPYCVQAGGECFQAFERQILRFPSGVDATWRDVKLSPLGTTGQ